MTTVHVALGERSYDVAIAADFAGFAAFLQQRSRARLAFVVTDERVVLHADKVQRSLSEAGYRVEVATIPSGEEQKCLATASELYDRLVEARADRKTLMIAVGGGVVGDLAGFVAATFNRGLAFVQVPTTLLAMVDSSVGGKVGINHPRGKNLIGAFHQPLGVWISLDVLNTLPDREFLSGLAEVVKYGVILDREFFEYLESQKSSILHREPAAISRIVERSCRLKADVVEKDERELTGLRAVLNYGHTFAHAFETIGGYGSWLHGEAVAAGMICASLLAERRGLIASDVTARQRELLTSFGLPVSPRAWSIDELIQVMRSDKKAESGQLRFILPTRMGEVRMFDDVPESEVRSVLRDLGCS